MENLRNSTSEIDKNTLDMYIMQMKDDFFDYENNPIIIDNTGEILDYCKKHDTNVKEEYTHITPSIVSKQFKYIGDKIHQPYAISRSMNY